MDEFINSRNEKLESLNRKYIEKENIMDKEVEDNLSKEKPHFSGKTLNLKKIEVELAKQGQ